MHDFIMINWENIKEYCQFIGLFVGIPLAIISVIFGVSYMHKQYESNFDYKIKVMDSKEGTTYYCQSNDIEIVDGILFIKPNITTTQFVITKLEKDND